MRRQDHTALVLFVHFLQWRDQNSPYPCMQGAEHQSWFERSAIFWSRNGLRAFLQVTQLYIYVSIALLPASMWNQCARISLCVMTSTLVLDLAVKMCNDLMVMWSLLGCRIGCLSASEADAFVSLPPTRIIHYLRKASVWRSLLNLGKEWRFKGHWNSSVNTCCCKPLVITISAFLSSTTDKLYASLSSQCRLPCVWFVQWLI